MSGKPPEGMDHQELELDEVNEKDILNATSLTHQHYNRMNITHARRRKRSFTKADCPIILESLYNFLMSNSTIANRDTDSRKLGNEIHRAQYLNESHKSLFKKFMASHDFSIGKSTLWLIIRRHSKFKIFKTPSNRNLQVALCDKCIKLELLKSNLENTELDFLDPADLLKRTICSSPELSCYNGSCKLCSKSAFTDYIKTTLPDNVDPKSKFVYAELVKSKNGEDILESETTIEDYLTINIPKIYYDLGATGTGNKMACHIERVRESNNYQKWCYEEVHSGNTVLFHMDYAMSLERRYGMETQNLHYKRKAFPVMGLIEYLPNGQKFWNFFCGELTQVKSGQFTIKAIRDMVKKLKDQIDDSAAITKVLINSDGATAEFWQSELIHNYPKIFDDIQKVLPNLKEVYICKSASGHGKGEIDAS